MRLSSPDLETSRKQPQQTKLHLSVFQPTVALKARVNNVAADKGDRVIVYDAASIGTFASVEAGMTLLVGSADGLSDIGKIRIRSATSSQFVVSENSNIEWADNQFLTVLRLWELWPVFPRIISDPADAENVIFYKDFDTVYSNQNSTLGTYVNAGPHRATFRDCASGQARLYYSSTGTYNLLGDSLNYNWTLEGGSPSSSTSANPGYVTYSAPGHYVTRLQVSGSSGAVDTTYRYVSIYDHPSCGTGTVPTSWEVTSFDGSRSEGGYNAKFKVRQSLNVTEGSVVVIFSEDWYGSTKQSFGGNYPNSSEIFFVGYVMRDTIRHNYKDSYVEFEASSLTGAMKNAIGFSVSVESKANPTKWFELAELDCRRAIYHYLKWHTTALSIADFQFVGTDQLLQFFDADRASMYDAIDNLLRGTLIGSVVSDRQGKVWAEVDAKAYTDPVTSFSPVMTITKRDWMGDPTVEERLSDEVSYLELGGIAYTGNSSGTFAALMASAPGNAPGFRGKIDRRQGLALATQTQLNQLVGNVWANENSRYPTVNLEMAVSARNLDIAPQETVQTSILSTDTARGVAINGLYIPESFNWRFEAKSGVLRPTVGFRNLVTGNAGETINIPLPEDAEGGFSVPGLQIPPLPVFALPSVGASPTGTSCCDSLAAIINAGVFCCLVTKREENSLGLNGNRLISWEYASNPMMYDPLNARIKFLNTGTTTAYNFRLEGDYADLGGSTIANEIFPIVYDGVTNAVLETGPVEIESVIGSSGHVISTISLGESSNRRYPNYIKLFVTGVQCDFPNQANTCSNFLWTNIRFTVCNNPITI